jgi:hypothetical protein
MILSRVRDIAYLLTRHSYCVYIDSIEKKRFNLIVT